MAEMRAAFEKEDDMFKVFRLMDECFSDGCFALKDLINDEQRNFLDSQIASTATNLDLRFRQIFDSVAPLMESMLNLGITPPPRFTAVADEHFHSQLLDEFMRRPIRPDNVQSLLETAKRRKIHWRQDALEPIIRKIIESLAIQAWKSPADINARRNLTAAVISAKCLPFAVDFHETQNHCYALLRNQCPDVKSTAHKGNADARSPWDEFQALGKMLFIKMDD
jgi:hypothetical protein